MTSKPYIKEILVCTQNFSSNRLTPMVSKLSEVECCNSYILKFFLNIQMQFNLEAFIRFKFKFDNKVKFLVNYTIGSQLFFWHILLLFKGFYNI